MVRVFRFVVWLLLIASGGVAVAGNDEFMAPDQVRMLPIVLVATDQPLPSRSQRSVWGRHLRLAREFFKTRLSGRDTFELAKATPEIIRLKKPLSFYKSLPKGESALHWADELLEHYRISRFRCPYTFCCLVMNPQERWPIGGGRTLNGGVNRGSGLLVMSSFAIDRLPNVQSTLRHEIAHTVGLPHVDVYGYDMAQSHSVMAYNLKHRTNGFRDSSSPAQLIPEDVRLLALAESVFQQLEFEPSRDLPTGYRLFPRVITLGPMSIPGRPEYGPQFSTPSGEGFGSKVTNLNRRGILPNQGPGVTFNPHWMWASNKQPSGQIVLNLSFPGEVSLDRMIIHSEHSGKYNRAEAVKIEIVDRVESIHVTDQLVSSADESIEFEAASGKDWRLTLTAGPSGNVCMRGLEYFSDEQQLFPPPVPYNWRERIGVNR